MTSDNSDPIILCRQHGILTLHTSPERWNEIQAIVQVTNQILHPMVYLLPRAKRERQKLRIDMSLERWNESIVNLADADCNCGHDELQGQRLKEIVMGA